MEGIRLLFQVALHSQYTFSLCLQVYVGTFSLAKHNTQGTQYTKIVEIYLHRQREFSAVGRQPAKLPVVTSHTLFTEWGMSYTTAHNRFSTTETWRYYGVLGTFQSTWNASIKIEEYQQ
jgi:hypothetical protein